MSRKVRIVSTDPLRAEVFVGGQKVGGIFKVEILMEAGRPHSAVLHVHPEQIDVTALDDSARRFAGAAA